MSGGSGTVTVRILGDASDFHRAVNGIDDGIGKMRNGFKSLALSVAAAFSIREVFRFGKSFVDVSRDLVESTSKSSIVFGKFHKDMEAWASTTTNNFGVSRRAALEAAGTYGNLFQAFGLGQAETAKMSRNLVELAADMASLSNTSIDDALKALRSGLSGETEPLKRYGSTLTEVRLKEKALSMGLIKTAKGPLPIAIRAQAAYALVLSDTSRAQGDFKRTSKDLANQQRILTAQIDNVKARIGNMLLPVVLAITTFLTTNLMPAVDKLGKYWKDNEDKIADLVAKGKELLKTLEPVGDFIKTNLRPILIALGAAIGIIVGGAGLSLFVFLLGALIGALTSPIVLIAALTAGVIFAYQHFEGFRNIVDTIIQATLPALAAAFGLVQTVTVRVVEIIIDMWNRFGRNLVDNVVRMVMNFVEIIRGAFNVIVGIFNFFTAVLTGNWAGAWEAIKQILAGVWWIIQGVVSSAIEAVRIVIETVMGVLSGIWAGLWHGFSTVIKDVWENIKDVVGSSVKWVLNHIDKMLGPLDEVIGKIGGLTGKTVGKLIPGFAGGVRNFSGGLALVGEEGPELVNLGPGSDVFSARDTANMLGGQRGGGVTVNVNGILAQDADTIANIVGRRLGFYYRVAGATR